MGLVQVLHQLFPLLMDLCELCRLELQQAAESDCSLLQSLVLLYEVLKQCHEPRVNRDKLDAPGLVLWLCACV